MYTIERMTDDDGQLEARLEAQDVFEPSDAFVSQANVSDPDVYERFDAEWPHCWEEAAESSAASVAETVETLQTTAEPDPERWFDAAVQTLVLGVVVDDLRTEAADLREWADREEKPFPTDVDDRIESLREETAARASALENRPDWEDQYDTRLETLETELAAVDPPVAWAQVDAHVAAAREGIGTGEPT